MLVIRVVRWQDMEVLECISFSDLRPIHSRVTIQGDQDEPSITNHGDVRGAVGRSPRGELWWVDS